MQDLLDEYNNLNDECSEDFEYFYDSNCDDLDPCYECDDEDDRDEDDRDDKDEGR